MAFRLYVVPIIGTGTRSDPRRPKYFADGTLTDNPTWTGMDYGFQNIMVVGADLSAADDALVAGEPDVTAVPVNLDTNPTSAQVTATQNKLGAVNIPANWVTTSLTWRQIVRSVLGMCTFMQRYQVISGQTVDFFATVTLDTTYGSLSSTTQNNLIATANDLGLSTAGLTATTKMRAIFKNMADQLDNNPYNFNGTLI